MRHKLQTGNSITRRRTQHANQYIHIVNINRYLTIKIMATWEPVWNL